MRSPTASRGTASRYTGTPVVVAASALVIALVVLAITDGSASAIVAVAGAIAIALWLRAARGGPELWTLALLAYAARLIGVALIARQVSGLVPDEAAFLDLSARLARYWHGEPVFIGWVSESYILGPWVYAQAAVLYVVGSEPAALRAPAAVFGTLTALAAYALAHPIAGRRAAMIAAVAVAAWPSLLLWSIVDLREAPTAFLVVAALGAFLRVARAKDARQAAGGALALFALGALRTAIAYAAGLGALAAAATRPGVRPVVMTAAAVAVGVAAVAALPSATANEAGGAPGTFAERRALEARGARTALVAPAPAAYADVVARPGDRLLVWDEGTEDPTKPTSSPPDLTPAGRTVAVAVPGVVTLGPAYARTGDAVVAHRDLVVIAGAPPSAGSPRLLKIGARGVRAGEDPEGHFRIRLRAAPTTAERVDDLLAEIAYLPHGLLAAMTAPSLLDARAAADVTAGLGSLLFLATCAAAAFASWRERSRWRDLVPIWVTVAALIVSIALGDGNAGTVFRHRAIVEPLLIVLAAQAIART